jgi:hypothetical protein
MKKRVIAGVMMVTMVASLAMGCGSDSSTADSSAQSNAEVTADANTDAATDEVPDFGGLVADYEPNPDYDKYAITEYTYEDLGETCVVLVCANEEETQFYCHFTFFGDEQIAEVSFDGGSYNVDYDKTGFVSKEVPVICQELVEAGVWAPIE